MQIKYIDMIDWLQNWYHAQCNGNWEHDYGVRIETLDNPGWSIEIDLVNTEVTMATLKWQLIEISTDNWIGYRVEDGKYSASGDPKKLDLLILIFKQIIEYGTITNSFVLEQMNSLKS